MITLLTIVTVLLALFVIGQLLSVSELSAKIKGRIVYDVTEKASKIQADDDIIPQNAPLAEGEVDGGLTEDDQ